MIRLGLCCKFLDAPIRFRVATATALARLSPEDRLRKISDLCLGNARAVGEAVAYCAEHGIGAFRVNSQILPVKTHPEVGYEVAELPEGEAVEAAFREAGRLAREHDVRLTFHPDQFVLLSSPKPEVIRRSEADLQYHAEVAEWLGADVLNIHGGGAYGDKASALARVRKQIEKLPDAVRCRLTLENDDRVYTPSDLLPVCRDTGVPLVYDAHHHRCLPDGLSVAQATEAALATWDREPLFHISSPIEGWNGPAPRRHHDFIDIEDFPTQWCAPGTVLTVDVEAKAKERAIAKLANELAAAGTELHLDRG